MLIPYRPCRSNALLEQPAMKRRVNLVRDPTVVVSEVRRMDAKSNPATVMAA